MSQGRIAVVSNPIVERQGRLFQRTVNLVGACLLLVAVAAIAQGPPGTAPGSDDAMQLPLGPRYPVIPAQDARLSAVARSDDQQQAITGGQDAVPRGDAAPPASSDRVSAQTLTITRPLSRFLSGRAAIDLRHARAAADVDIPLPKAWKPEQLMLRLKYRNSVNLLEAHSQLRVELNGLIIAQFKLDPDRPEGEARIRLPVELLEPRYNQLRFWVAQHTLVGECENPLAPELWTQIDAVESSLTLDYRTRSVARTLGEVADLLGEYAWSQARLHIAMAVGSDGPNAEQLEWGALVAQGAAVRLRYRSLDVALRSLDELDALATDRELMGSAPDGLVLVGTASELEPVLGPEWADDVTDAYLGLLHGDPDDPMAADRLVVSGVVAEEVKRAAIVLGLVDLPLPDTSEVLIGEVALPTVPPDSGQRALLDDAVASFADLGVQTTTLGSELAPATNFAGADRGGSARQRPRSIGFDFWVPPGFHPGRRQQGLLTLDFSYGAKLRGDSVLNLSLNGIFVRGIPLDNPVGAAQIGYQVRFPFGLLIAGHNRLEITPVLVPSFSDPCELRQGENLRFTLYDSSSLMLPEVQRLATLPDLKLFSRAGFPLLRDPTGGHFGVQLAGRDPSTVSAAWTLLSRLAQVVQMPLYRVQIGYRPWPDKFAALVVGPLAEIDPDLRAASPLSEQEGRFWIDYPVLDLIDAQEPTGGWAERGLERLQRWIDPPAGERRSYAAQVAFGDGGPAGLNPGVLFGREGGLFEFESSDGQTTVMLTASTAELLQARAARLVQPDFWYNLAGGLAVWDADEDSLQTRRVDDTFTIGEVTAGNRINHLLNAYPQALAAITLLLLLLLVSLLFVVTRRFRRRQAPKVFTEE